MNIDFFGISHLWPNNLTPSNFYVQLAALLTLIVIIIINLVVGILPHVDNFAHIGGFLSGFLLGFVFLIRPQFGWVSQKNSPPGSIATTVKSKHKTYQYILWVLSLIILVVGYVPRILSLYVNFMYLIVFPAQCLFSWCSLGAVWEFFWITSLFLELVEWVYYLFSDVYTLLSCTLLVFLAWSWYRIFGLCYLWLEMVKGCITYFLSVCDIRCVRGK